MRNLLALVLLVALAAPAAAFSLPSLPSVADVPLPSLFEVAPADAAERLDASVPAIVAGEEEPGSATQLRTTRTFVSIDAQRRASAAGESVALASEAVPMVARVATVDFEYPWAVPADEPTMTPVERAPETAAARAAPASEPALAAVATASLAAGMIFHFAVALYHRIAPSQALAHETRRAVHAEVARRGAATAGEIAELLALHPKTARYHLDLLASFQLLVRDADGAYRVPGLKREAEPTLEDAIVSLVETRPGLNMAEVARELGVGKSTAQERVTALLLEGRLASRRDERARLLYPAAIASVA